MMPLANETHLQHIRESLQEFWSEHLQIEQQGDTLVLAYPLMRPDGVQIVLSLRQVTPTTGILSDEGKTLMGLDLAGLNIESATTLSLLDERLNFYEIKRSGWNLFRPLELPVEPVQVQLFAEGLVSIGHLIYRQESGDEEENVAQKSVEKIFSDKHLHPKRNAVLEGRVEKSIRVAYFLEGPRGMAMEVISRKNNLHGYMQQWGWRWSDLKQQQPKLIRAMVYDADRQELDEMSLNIGKSVCDIFCPYHETAQIEEAIEMAQSN